MRLPVRLLTVLLSLAPVAAGAAPKPLEKFVPRNADAVLVIPSLETFAKQGKALFDVVVGFPGAGKLRDGRAVIRGRLGFDLLGPESMREAGLDPRRGAVLYVIASGDTWEGSPTEGALVVPIANAARFEATLAAICKEQLTRAVRTVLPGSPKVVVWRGKGPREEVAYAITGGHAVIGMEHAAARRVRKTLAIPASGHLGTTPAYRKMSAALGSELAALGFLPPGSKLLDEQPMLRGGASFGFGGSAERARVVWVYPLTEGGKRAVAEATDPRAFLNKLDPGASIVVHTGIDLRAIVPRESFGTGNKERTPEKRERWDAYYDALGPGMALGLRLAPLEEGAPVPSAVKEPLALLQGELVLGLSDPEGMKRTLREMMNGASAEDGPWVVPESGGELGFHVQDGRLVFAVGPSGTMRALAQRRRSSFSPPSDAAAAALRSKLGGGYVDVEGIVAGLRGLSDTVFRDTAKAEEQRAKLEQVLSLLSRIRVASFTAEPVGDAVRAEVVVELAPEGEHGEWGEN